jgi:UDPglucose 6-dehydrogenase
MNVGIVGLGKLGLPVAYAMASRGLTVNGYDPFVAGPPADPSYEAGFADVIAAAEDRMRFAALPDVVAHSDVVFVAVQTPHEPRFEGITPIPCDRADFNYSYLVDAVAAIDAEATRQGRDVTVSVISTVLPGTMRRYVLPILGPHVTLVYNPSFIAMGTTIRDFLDPEFVLLGGDTGAVDEVFTHVYDQAPVGWVADQPRRVRTTIDNAELIKVSYNTFIGLKIAFANTVMEVCHKTDCDVDEVMGALQQANRRLISPAYLDGGMGDGGGCHPRDNIALSWLAGELDLSYDLFNAAMECRERQAEWLVDLMEDHGLGMGLLGVAYKPESALTAGSPALLVRHLLEQRGHHVWWTDPYVSSCRTVKLADEPRCYLIGCKHPEFPDVRFPAGSVVIDPFRYMPDQDGVTVIRVGEG